jgi:hypothetical protein
MAKAFTNTLIKQCFPHKEAILFNLGVAVELANASESIQDDERIHLLCSVMRCLEDKNWDGAISAARAAGYNLMAEAIKVHFEQ